MFLRPPCGCFSMRAIASAVIGWLICEPLSSEKISARCTWSFVSGFPSTLNPAITITVLANSGIGGLWFFGAFDDFFLGTYLSCSF